MDIKVSIEELATIVAARRNPDLFDPDRNVRVEAAGDEEIGYVQKRLINEAREFILSPAEI